MSTRVPETLRRAVLERAGRRCEYCLLPERFSRHALEADHVFSDQHGGSTVESNLAASCMRCNRAKGPNVAAIDDESGDPVTLFHPRRQDWPDHFRRDGVEIVGLTAVGRATVRVLAMNDEARFVERRIADAAARLNGEE